MNEEIMGNALSTAVLGTEDPVTSQDKDVGDEMVLSDVVLAVEGYRGELKKDRESEADRESDLEFESDESPAAQRTGNDKKASLKRAAISVSKKNEKDEKWVQCKNCRKWRIISEHAQLPEQWFCSMNVDNEYNHCFDAQQSWDSENSYTSSGSQDEEDDYESIRSNEKIMDYALENQAWKMLYSYNSSQPQWGASMLRATMFDCVPRDQLKQDMWNAVAAGPVAYDRQTPYKDPNKAQHVYDVAMYHISGTSNTSFGPSTWNEVELCLSQPIRTTSWMNSIFSILQSDSPERKFFKLGTSLQLAANCLSCYEVILKAELKDGKSQNTLEPGTRMLFAGKPNIQLLLNSTICNTSAESSRNALKFAVRSAAQCWIRHGHFDIGDGKDLFCSTCNDEDCCRNEAHRCLELLGSIVSHYTFIFCAEEGLSIGCNECAFILRDVLESSFQEALQSQSDFGLRSEIGKKRKSEIWKQFSRCAKLWFILSLKESFAAPLRETLAAMHEESYMYYW